MFNGTDISSTWKTPEKTSYKAVDLFCGCGGLSCGLQQAGFQMIGGVEFDKNAYYTYSQNFTHEIVLGDITQDATKQMLYEKVNHSLNGAELDLLAGGFPCQGFSMSGLRDVDDMRNKLYLEFVDIAARLQPKWIIGENVDALLTMKKGAIALDIIERFRSIGYDMTCLVLNAADYGVPQIRKRVFFIGNRMGVENRFPNPIYKESNYVSVSKAIGDLAYSEENKAFSQIYKKHKKDMIERLSNLKPGGHLYASRKDSWRRLQAGMPSFTVKNNNGACAVHYKEHRLITPREMARLQSFPDEFLFYGAVGMQQKQIGNAVCSVLNKLTLLTYQYETKQGHG